MSKALEEYGDRKSCAVTTAKRLAQFLGDERIKDKGLACNYVVAECVPRPSLVCFETVVALDAHCHACGHAQRDILAHAGM